MIAVGDRVRLLPSPSPEASEMQRADFDGEWFVRGVFDDKMGRWYALGRTPGSVTGEMIIVDDGLCVVVA